MRIEYNNVHAYCFGDEDEIGEVRSILSYTPKGARYYKVDEWKEKRSIFNSRWNRFPAGLMEYVHKKFSREIEYNDRRPNGKIEPDLPVVLWNEKTKDALEFYDYQKRAIDAFLEKERGIVKLSTRAGKTVIGIAIAKALSRRTLFVVHTQELLMQTYRQMKSKLSRQDIGLIGGGHMDIEKFSVGIVKTLSNPNRELKQWLSEVELIIFDEVHRSSKMYQDLSALCPMARYRLGLSATPFKEGKEGKMRTLAITGPIIFEIKMKKLVDSKHIAKPTITFIKHTCIEGQTEGNFDEQYYQGIIGNENRNTAIAIIALRELKLGKSTLILIEKLEHGDILYELLKDRCRVEFVSGQLTDGQRDQMRVNFESGLTDVLIASRIYNEGVDIPFLENVIVAGGYKSSVLSYQRYGRGITKTAWKETTKVWDFLDEHYYYDWEGELKNGILYNHSLKRLQLCKKDKAFEVKTINMEDLL